MSCKYQSENSAERKRLDGGQTSAMRGYQVNKRRAVTKSCETYAYRPSGNTAKGPLSWTGRALPVENVTL